VAGFDLRTEGVDRLQRVARALREADASGQLKRDMTSALRKASGPGLDKARANMMAERLPADNVEGARSEAPRGGGGQLGRARVLRAQKRTRIHARGGAPVLTERQLRAIAAKAPLRATIAAAMTVSVITSPGRAGVTVKVSKAKLRAFGIQSLPYDIEQGSWRHPVLGNRSVWVTQHGQTWFRPAMISTGPLAQRELERVLNEFADRINRSI